MKKKKHSTKSNKSVKKTTVKKAKSKNASTPKKKSAVKKAVLKKSNKAGKKMKKQTIKKATPVKKAAKKIKVAKKAKIKKIVAKKTVKSRKKAVLKKSPIVKPRAIKSPQKKTSLKKIGGKRPNKKVVLKKSAPIKMSADKPAIKKDNSLKEISSDKPKREFRPKQTGAPRYFFNTEIPAHYNETYIRALPRDPDWIFVYWEFSSETLDNFINTMGEDKYNNSKRILRISDITDIIYNGKNAWSQIDIDINNFANDWYIKLPCTGRTYCVECGHISQNGRYYMLARSNSISVPQSSVSDLTDEEWIKADADKLIRASGSGISYINASENLTKNLGGSSDNFYSESVIKQPE